MPADIGLRAVPNSRNRVLQYDEANLQVLGRRVRDLPDVGPVVGIEGIERSGVERLIRAEQTAESRARIQAGVGGCGHGVLRQADAAEGVAEAIPRDHRLRRCNRH